MVYVYFLSHRGEKRVPVQYSRKRLEKEGEAVTHNVRGVGRQGWPEPYRRKRWAVLDGRTWTLKASRIEYVDKYNYLPKYASGEFAFRTNMYVPLGMCIYLNMCPFLNMYSIWIYDLFEYALHRNINGGNMCVSQRSHISHVTINIFYKCDLPEYV